MLLAKADALVAALRDRGLEHRDTLRVGRTHGIHAEPDVFGHRLADLAFGAGPVPGPAAAGPGRRSRWRRSPARWGRTRRWTRQLEASVARSLGLRPADVATQVVLRDGIAEWVSALAILVTVCEAVGLEVRHGQRTEVRELSEPFRAGQKGSSAMPHKKNPIMSERIAGLARIVRVVRDAGHRGHPALARAGHLALLDRADRAAGRGDRHRLPAAADPRLVEGMVVDADRMRANLESTGGLVYTSAVLLDLVRSGLSREDAYALTQAAAMETWEGGAPFRETLRAHAAAAGVKLDEAGLDEVMRPERYVARLGPVFDRLAALRDRCCYGRSSDARAWQVVGTLAASRSGSSLRSGPAVLVRRGPAVDVAGRPCRLAPGPTRETLPG